MTNFKTAILTIFALPLLSLTIAQIELETKSILNDRVEIKVPSEFDFMSEDMMKLKYPSERRPTVVYTNESGGNKCRF